MAEYAPMVRVYSPHCPNCAAALSFDPSASSVDCDYCSATLILDLGRVTYRRTRAPRVSTGPEETEEGAQLLPIDQPDPSLVTRDAARFSLRILEQKRADPSPEIFRSVELDGMRFAVATLRCVDEDENPIVLDLTSAWNVLAESLTDDGDPGLAVNLALEEISRNPKFKKLQAAVALLDPERTTALVYCAGIRDGVMWVSTEEARPIYAGPAHQALEKSDLAKSGDQFDNGRELQLAALDLIVMTSFAYLRDPVIGRNGASAMTNTLRENLAEDPERVVTLIKNAFWEARDKRGDDERDIAGDIIVAAVGARLAAPEVEVDATKSIEALETSRFAIALQRQPGDMVALRPLDENRHGFVWAAAKDGALATEAFEELCEGVYAVLGKMGHGDFDNPRAAGRAGLARMGAATEGLSVLVAHLSDEHRRLKYFTKGWKAGAMIGARSIKSNGGQQQFDEGGELSLGDNERILFPGELPYEGQVLRAEDLSERWYGGKSSHLYEALRLHWRTRKCEKALAKLVAAARADVGAQGTVRALGLFTGK